jgi:hypothetical protein
LCSGSGGVGQRGIIADLYPDVAYFAVLKDIDDETDLAVGSVAGLPCPAIRGGMLISLGGTIEGLLWACSTTGKGAPRKSGRKAQTVRIGSIVSRVGEDVTSNFFAIRACFASQ